MKPQEIDTLMETDIGKNLMMFDVGPDLMRRPQPLYQKLRELSASVHIQGEMLRRDGSGVIVCTREEVDEVLHRPDLFSSNMPGDYLKNARPLIPLHIDPPDHKKYRKILDQLFAPRRMQEFEEHVVHLTNALIDSFIDEGKVDFVRQFSVPLPGQAMLALLGLPLEDLPLFLKFKDGIIRPHYVIGTELGHPDADEYQRAIAKSVYEYVDRVLDNREIEPGDDLFSRLLDTEVDGERLTREELLDSTFLFLVAGLDTVMSSLDCFWVYFAEHPEQRQRVVDDPTIIPQVVEELLRMETPVGVVVRTAARDTELHGCPIRAGEHISVVLGSANTDEHGYQDPEVVQWDRQANRHLAFGGGIHRCLGSHLARLELRVALREWHARIPDYSIAPGAELTYLPGVRSLETLPMEFSSQTA